MAEKKPTIKQQYAEVKVVLEKAERPDLVAFIDGRVAVLEKKSENRKPTKEQKVNEELKDRIVKLLTETAKPMTATEVLNADTEAFVSLPKVTSLLTALKNEGRIVREQDKKKAYFKVVAE